MPASEETGSGPVIHDHRRIDPVTGQVRGKHVASKPAGTRGAGRPAPAADAAETAETAETAESTGSARSAGSQEDQDAQETQKYPEEVPEVVTPEAVPGKVQIAHGQVELAVAIKITECEVAWHGVICVTAEVHARAEFEAALAVA